MPEDVTLDIYVKGKVSVSCMKRNIMTEVPQIHLRNNHVCC